MSRKRPCSAINERGLRIEDKAGNSETLRIRATASPGEIGIVDLLLVFVKCYHTETAVRQALPAIGPNTTVLSLQNGWGNGPRIGAIVGKERLLLGVCYHSATVAGPGHVQHLGTWRNIHGRARRNHERTVAARCGDLQQSRH